MSMECLKQGLDARDENGLSDPSAGSSPRGGSRGSSLGLYELPYSLDITSLANCTDKVVQSFLCIIKGWGWFSLHNKRVGLVLSA